MLPGLPVCRAPVKSVLRLHEETKRVEQRVRVAAALDGKAPPLASVEVASGVRAKMRDKRADAETEEARRSILPSVDVVRSILGFFEYLASFRGKAARGDWGRPIHDVELAAEEIAGFIRYSRSTVFAALRWMDSHILTTHRLGLAEVTRMDDSKEQFPVKRTPVRCLSAEAMGQLQVNDPPRFLAMVQKQIERVQLEREAAALEERMRQGQLFRPCSAEEDAAAAAAGLQFAERFMKPAELEAYRAARAQRMRGS